jgi:hypothetical protein
MIVLHGGPGLRGYTGELVVRARMGGVLYRRLLGSARPRQDLPAQDPATIKPTLTPDQIVADARELITWVRKDLEGRHDRNVNADVAAEWFAKVKAPEKHIVWLERSARLPDDPGKFLVSVVRYARPLAEASGDAAP